MNMKTCTLTATLLEDLHTGTGMGSGAVDRVLARDSKGRPYLPATHIKGVWRDLAFQLLDLAGGTLRAGDRAWTRDEVLRLFGKADGQVYEAALELLSLKPVTATLECLTWASSAREIDNRAPLDDTLRINEYVAAGTKFQGTLILRLRDGTEASLLNLEALLKVILNHCAALGSFRNRGAGRVCWTLADADAGPATQARQSPEPGQRRLRVILRALEPLCLADTAFAGNLIRGECFIRGQALLGALTAWAHQRNDAATVELLLSRRVRVGNAYPLPDSAMDRADWRDAEVLPMPLHVYRSKAQGGSGGAAPWWIRQPEARGLALRVDQFADLVAGGKSKRPGEREFLYRRDTRSPWRIYQPQMSVRLRSQCAVHRPDNDKEPSFREADLFSQQEIAEGTRFSAELLVADDADARRLNAGLPNDWIKLGRGGMPVALEDSFWLTPISEVPNRRAAQLRITLTSDLIVRDAYLNFYDELSLPAVCQAAGLDARQVPGRLAHTKHFSDHLEIRGFNAASGFNRNAAIAIRRGSTLEISADDLSALRQRLSDGEPLGERTWEGYGRYRVDFDPFRSGAEDIETFLLRSSRAVAETLSMRLERSQWERLRKTVLSSPLDVEACLASIEDTISGKRARDWTQLIDALKKALHDHAIAPEHQVRFIDYTVRWRCAGRPKQQEYTDGG